MTIRGRVFVDLDFGPSAHIVQTLTFENGFSTKGQGNMSVTIPSMKAVVATIQLMDAAGNLTTFDATPVWSVSDALLLRVTPDATGYSAEIRSLGPIGAGQLRVTGDADLGEGTRDLNILDDVTIVAGDALTGVFGFGPVID